MVTQGTTNVDKPVSNLGSFGLQSDAKLSRPTVKEEVGLASSRKVDAT